MGSQDHMSPLEDNLQLTSKEQLALSECLPLSYLQASLSSVTALLHPPTLSSPTLPHLSRFWHNLLWGAFPETSGCSAHSHPLSSCAWTSSIRAAVLLGYECRFFVWFPLSPEDKVQPGFIFEFSAPGAELAHFGFSKYLLSKGVKSWTND